MSNVTVAGLPFDEYKRLPAWNWSSLKWMRQTPAHARAAKSGLLAMGSEFMAFGSLAHVCLLEPDEFEGRYVVTDLDRRGTKAWDAEAAAAGGATLVKRSDYDDALAIRKNVRAHPLVAALLSGKPHYEVTIQHHHQSSGLPLKSRLDIVNRRIVADFKTCESAAPEGMGKRAYGYAYHAQAAMYRRAADAAWPGEPHGYLLVMAETKPPFAVAVYEPTPRWLEIGERDMDRWIHQAANCEASGEWPAYPIAPEPLDIPAWADKQEEAFDVTA